MTVVGSQIRKLVVESRGSLLDCLRVIDRGGCGASIVVDGESLLVGLVTDGDVRRALLSGADLGDPLLPFVQSKPLVVTTAVSRPHVLDLMRSRGVALVPVIDPEGRVIGVHSLTEFLSPRVLSTVAVVMAGGLGSRLGDLTTFTPKPMLPVAGRPVLEWIVLRLVGEGVRRIYISTGYLAEQVEDHFGDGSSFGCSISYLRDPPTHRLGSGGALGLYGFEEANGDPILVMNGDLMTHFNLAAMLNHHQSSGAKLTLAVRTHETEIPYGVVTTNKEGFVGALEEKPVASWTVNAGVYLVDPGLIKHVDSSREFRMTELVEKCLQNEERVAVWRIDGDWVDIGARIDLARAQGFA